MITPTTEKLNNMRTTSDNRLPRETGGTVEGHARRHLPTVRAKHLTENTESVKKELDAVRTEHAKLQQAVYEAAQIQRRLCAPREIFWGEFEIAGEIFPVRHLSGDFFTVMELNSVLGLAVGDIAGKGLSA